MSNRPKSEEKSVQIAEVHLYLLTLLLTKSIYFNENQICIFIIGAKRFNFWPNKFSFEQKFQNTGLKTRNGEKFSLLYLLFIENLYQSLKSFLNKTPCCLRIRLKTGQKFDKNFQCEVYQLTAIDEGHHGTWLKKTTKHICAVSLSLNLTKISRENLGVWNQ